jgi:hypothetical protein
VAAVAAAAGDGGSACVGGRGKNYVNIQTLCRFWQIMHDWFISQLSLLKWHFTITRPGIN